MSKRAAVFAGQGAQFVGMAGDLAETDSDCAALFNRANEVLGYDLAKICFEGPEEELRRSNHCQPGIFAASIACWSAFRRRSPETTFSAAVGLSLGEWSALHAAGVLSFDDTLRVLEARGRFMQDACAAQDGAMVSVIGLGAGELRRICAETGVEISNFNSEAQTVLSGERDRITAAEKLANDAGAKKTVMLNVAGAYHSRLMIPAAERLAEVLADTVFSTPSIPVISNVTGKHHGEPDEIRQNMVRQVTSPVYWLAGIRCVKEDGVSEYVEFGPGKVLSGLIRRIDRNTVVNNVQDCESLERTVNALQ